MQHCSRKYLQLLATTGRKRSNSSGENDKFSPIPLSVFFENYQLHLDQSQAEALSLFNQHISQQQDEAQVLSLSGYDNVLNRSRSILNLDSKLILMAAFSSELITFKKEIESIQRSEKEINILSFGRKPEWLNHVSEHLSEDLIEKAQGGRLLMIAGFPQALIAVIRKDGTASGIWAWNQILGSSNRALYLTRNSHHKNVAHAGKVQTTRNFEFPS